MPTPRRGRRMRPGPPEPTRSGPAPAADRCLAGTRRVVAMIRSWDAHLPAGARGEDLDLTAQGSLPAAWASVWARAGSSRVLLDPRHGWITAAELEEATRRIAGRLQ